MLVIIALVAVGMPVVLVVAAVAAGRRRAEAAARPPRRTHVGSNGAEIHEPGQPADVVAHCWSCSWQASDPTALGAHAALTEHVRRHHGGIA